MGLTELLLTAIALAMDAFAVSVTNGASLKNIKTLDCLKIGLYFGLFQFLMPILGFSLAFSFKEYILDYDHWIAFFLLLFIGAKMIKESFEKGSADDNIMSTKNLLILAIATSIDAMAVGITLALTTSNILYPAAIIGLVAFAFSFFGAKLGNKIGEFFKTGAEWVGGLILIGIGLKILLEHTL
ncbi:MAG: manganese efflux pump MntP family protein [Clostridiales bacterium]|nr:manganese efflux pump MntP family protein [Clostridiales bacterium]